MTVHAIRLRGFWTATPAGYSRAFGRPRTLSPGESAWLVGEAGATRVFLNGQLLGPLPAGEPFAFEVTSALQVRNTIEIETPSDAPAEVRLEIRTARR